MRQEPAKAGKTGPPVVAVDAMGGDHAPDEIVAGALAAQREQGIRVVLTGPAARLRSVAAGLGAGAGELRIVSAEDNIAMNEGALASLRRPGPASRWPASWSAGARPRRWSRPGPPAASWRPRGCG